MSKRNYSGSKNEMMQLLIPDFVLKPSIAIHDFKNIIAYFDCSKYLVNTKR